MKITLSIDASQMRNLLRAHEKGFSAAMTRLRGEYGHEVAMEIMLDAARCIHEIADQVASLNARMDAEKGPCG